MTLNNTLISQPRLPTSTIMNRPQIIYIRSPTPWRGINGYNGLQPQGVPTKLIRIVSGNCMQQPICITSPTSVPPGTNSESETKSNAISDNNAQQLEKTTTYVQSPISTLGTNQNGPILSYNPIRMVTTPSPLGIHPQQMARPVYQSNLHPNIPSQSMRCQQIQIIHRPSNGLVNPMNVVRTQVILPHQTSDNRNLQRPSSIQPLQAPFRPNSLQTQSQICAWPQPMAPASHYEGTQNSHQSSVLSNSHASSQSWQVIPINTTNCIQSLHVNKSMQPPTFQSENNVFDLQSKNSIGLVSQVSTTSSPLTTQNPTSTTKSTNKEVIKSQEVQLQSSLKPPFAYPNIQSIDVEYEKLMALVGIT